MNITVLLNSDVEVTENWIEPDINLFERNPDIAAFSLKYFLPIKISLNLPELQEV
jgi:GT2 family glycosyltransferase